MLEKATALGELACAEAGSAAARTDTRSVTARALARGAFVPDGDEVRAFRPPSAKDVLPKFVVGKSGNTRGMTVSEATVGDERNCVENGVAEASSAGSVKIEGGVTLMGLLVVDEGLARSGSARRLDLPRAEETKLFSSIVFA